MKKNRAFFIIEHCETQLCQLEEMKFKEIKGEFHLNYSCYEGRNLQARLQTMSINTRVDKWICIKF